VRPSEQRKQEDMRIVEEAARKSGFADYSDSLNPYPHGTLRYERVKRHYGRKVKRFRQFEPHFNHVCEVYGFI
jgi:hypothetical protein